MAKYLSHPSFCGGTYANMTDGKTDERGNRANWKIRNIIFSIMTMVTAMSRLYTQKWSQRSSFQCFQIKFPVMRWRTLVKKWFVVSVARPSWERPWRLLYIPYMYYVLYYVLYIPYPNCPVCINLHSQSTSFHIIPIIISWHCHRLSICLQYCLIIPWHCHCRRGRSTGNPNLLLFTLYVKPFSLDIAIAGGGEILARAPFHLLRLWS